MRLKETVRQWNTQWIDSRNQNYFIQHRSEYEIEKFRNIHESEDCFIIGNGPSLRPEDLDKIHELGYCSFASNKIYNIFKSTKWRPTYVTVSDPQFIRNKKILYNIEQIMPEMFFMRSQFAKDVKGLHCRTCPINANPERKLLDAPEFSLDCSEIIYDIATVTYFSMQIAAYMGFKNMYLVGMDNRYAYSRLRDGTIVRNEGVASWFSDNGQDIPDPSTAGATWEMDVAYEYAEQFSRTHGFRIYNATRGGFLEKFERVNLDEILAERPV